MSLPASAGVALLLDDTTGTVDQARTTASESAACQPGRPPVRLRLAVMARPALIWVGTGWLAAQAVIAGVLACWLGDARLPGIAAIAAALAACCWWYRYYPIGLYEPVSNGYTVIGPWGLAWRQRPSRPGAALVLHGNRIVETGRRPRTVMRSAWVRPGEWRSLARAVHRGSGRCVLPPERAARPAFITHRHRATGAFLAGLALAGACQTAAASFLAVNEGHFPRDEAAAVTHQAESTWEQ